MSCYSNILLSS